MNWGIVWRYLVGSTLMFLVLRLVAVLPSKATLYIGLGLIPFAADLLPRKLTPDITRPGAPYICGAFIITLQLLAGAAGHILDIFFQKSQLDRKTIVGTKAVTQVTGHLYRIRLFRLVRVRLRHEHSLVGVRRSRSRCRSWERHSPRRCCCA